MCGETSLASKVSPTGPWGTGIPRLCRINEINSIGCSMDRTSLLNLVLLCRVNTSCCDHDGKPDAQEHGGQAHQQSGDVNLLESHQKEEHSHDHKQTQIISHEKQRLDRLKRPSQQSEQIPFQQQETHIRYRAADENRAGMK